MLIGEPREGNARGVSFSLRQIQEAPAPRRLSFSQSASSPTACSLRQVIKGRWFHILFCIVSICLTPCATAHQSEGGNVLVFYSMEREMATYAALDKGLRSEL